MSSKKMNIILISALLLYPLVAIADIKIYFGAPAYNHHYKSHSYSNYKYNRHEYNHYRKNRYYSPYSNHRHNYYSYYSRKKYNAPYKQHRRHHAYEQGFYDGLHYNKKRKYSRLGYK